MESVRKERKSDTATSNQQSVDELDIPINRIFPKHKVYFSFMYNISGSNLVDTQLIDWSSKGISFPVMCMSYLFQK